VTLRDLKIAAAFQVSPDDGIGTLRASLMDEAEVSLSSSMIHYSILGSSKYQASHDRGGSESTRAVLTRELDRGGRKSREDHCGAACKGKKVASRANLSRGARRR